MLCCLQLQLQEVQVQVGSCLRAHKICCFSCCLCIFGVATACAVLLLLLLLQNSLLAARQLTNGRPDPEGASGLISTHSLTAHRHTDHKKHTKLLMMISMRIAAG
jgi:hypothetical protein